MLHVSPSGRFWDADLLTNLAPARLRPSGSQRLSILPLPKRQDCRLTGTTPRESYCRAQHWRWRVTLPHDTACKAGAFLVEPHPHMRTALHSSAAPCRPGAAPGLGGFGDLPVLAGTRHNCELKNLGASSAAFGWPGLLCCPGRRRRQEAARGLVREDQSLPARCARPGNK